jgi:hypothetical protein
MSVSISRYQPIAEPEELDNGRRIQWVEGRPGEAPATAGTDFIIAHGGQIAAIYLFSTSYREQCSAVRPPERRIAWKPPVSLRPTQMRMS